VEDAADKLLTAKSAKKIRKERKEEQQLQIVFAVKSLCCQ